MLPTVILGLIIGSKLLEQNTDLDRLKLYNNIVVRSLRVLSAKLFYLNLVLLFLFALVYETKNKHSIKVLM